MQTLKGSDFNCDFPLPDEGDEFFKNPHSECRSDLIHTRSPQPNTTTNASMDAGSVPKPGIELVNVGR